jgi:hypothetical protein
VKYLIEVRPIVSIDETWKPRSKVHAEIGFGRYAGSRVLCGSDLERPELTEAPVTCKRCLAILEKQGRVE